MVQQDGGAVFEQLALPKRKLVLSACDGCKRRKVKCKHQDNRRILRRACDRCRKSKIRCIHGNSDEDSTQASLGKRKEGSSEETKTPPRTKRHRPNSEPARFIGDLNPESTLLESGASNMNHASSDRVGVWIRSWPEERCAPDQPRRGVKNTSNKQFQESLFPDPMMESFLLPYLETQCRSFLPNISAWRLLRNSYFEGAHCLFPILSQTDLDDSDAVTPESLLLQLGVCLMATSPSSSLSAGSIRKQVSAMATMIDYRIVRDSIVISKACAILSLFAEGMLGGERASEYANLAVHHIHSQGLHLSSGRAESSEKLFLCVWIVDRINAALHGRPVLMHERDTGRDVQKLIGQQLPLFQLFLRITFTLDCVIGLYRPLHISEPLNQSIPEFDELAFATSRVSEDAVFLLTLQIFYYAVRVLSYREKGGPLHSRDISMYEQRYHLSQEILLLAESFGGKTSLRIPLVPYAVSLCMSIAYRGLKVAVSIQEQGKRIDDLQRGCDTLKEVGHGLAASARMIEAAEDTIRIHTFGTNNASHTHENEPKSNPTGGNTAGMVPLGEDSTQPPEDGPVSLEQEPLFTFDLDGIDWTLWSNLELSLPTDFEGPSLSGS